MGLLSRRLKIDFESIVSVVVLEQTQLYKRKSNLGLSFGSSIGDSRVIAMDENVPSGTETKFSVTFKDGKKKIITAMSGTDECTRLLQLAIDPPNKEFHVRGESKKGSASVQLQKNQLANGQYTVGEEIPAGSYDFTWIFGSGRLLIFKDSSDTKTLGACRYFQWIGNRYDYEFRQCINVDCEDGNVIVLAGNLIVEISKSRKPQIDL
ncbi:MAG: hypothetical protein LUF00_13140 [Lachnospiraceae bacterium]|nr:hypothetical protein [Lachnospiraceae bacterium]